MHVNNDNPLFPQLKFLKMFKICLEEEGSSSDGDAAVPEMEFKEEWDMLSAETQKKLKERGVIQLFPVQAKTFKTVREGNDVIVQSRTGSG